MNRLKNGGKSIHHTLRDALYAASRSSAVGSRHKCRHKRDSIVSLYIVSPAAGRKSNSVLFGRIYTGIRYSERGPRHIKIERAQ